MRGFPRTPNQIAPKRAKTKERQKKRRSFSKPLFRLHPLFIAVGIFYACTGELFLFLLSTLVAVQHECAHAFAAARLGYRLNAVVLMPYGAVIDGDLKGISVKDEIYVAICGPLCNLATALFFGALWWFAPTTYAFTDVAFYSSLAIALVNLLPCYPLDGGRILKCLLLRGLLKKYPQAAKAEGRAEVICRVVSLSFSLLALAAFILQCVQKQPNFTLLAFGGFLFVGALGNRDKATYEKMEIPFSPPLERGVEIRRVAVADSCQIKDAFRFLARGSYLILEVYDKNEKHLFDLPQSKLAELFTLAATPYETLYSLWKRQKSDVFV